MNFFAPHHAYSTDPTACAQKSKFREMVKALHAAGIEIILDVVFNHTCEGDENGPTYSFEGIDNSTYYLVSPGSRNPYANFSGCGNTLHTANRAVHRLIVDSLRYWATERHEAHDRFSQCPPFIVAIPLLARGCHLVWSQRSRRSGPAIANLAFFLQGRKENDTALYVMINGDDVPDPFEVQQAGDFQWKQVVSAGVMSPHDIESNAANAPDCEGSLTLTPRSIPVLVSSVS